MTNLNLSRPRQVPCKGLIFDLDGTLLDTLRCIGTAINTALKRLGYPTHPISEFRNFIGDGVFKCAERALPEDARRAPIIEELVAQERQIYDETWADEIAVYPGIASVLAELTHRDIPTAVLTNKDQEAAESCLQHCFPEHAFQGIIGFNGRFPHKPDPSGGQLLIESLGLPPHQLAMIGDTPVDIETARACSLIAVGVSWGFRDRDVLLAAECDHLIDDPKALLQLID